MSHKVDDGGIKLRTWERGAGLTRACGTGACATAVAAIAASARSRRSGDDARRVADDRMGAGRADPHARRRDACVRGEIDLEALRMSVETITLGCRLNFAESEAMRAARAAGDDW